MNATYDFPPCAWPGCTKRPRVRSPLCTEHQNLRQNNTGHGGPRSRLTSTQRADIAARVRRFEDPLAIAKEYGIDRRTVLSAVARAS